MAHQSHSIPWYTLANNLKYMHRTPRNHGITNLYLRRTKDTQQVKELRYFIQGFVSALEEYSTVERKKYDADPITPDEDEILISASAVKKMGRTVLRYKSSGENWSALGQRENITLPESLDDILSPYERSARRFIRDTELGESDMYHGAGEACEQTKTLLMYGEMDALLRLAAHPEVRFFRLWHEADYANSHGFGLYKLMEAALMAYICLNVGFVKSELYDVTSREAFPGRGGERKGEGHKSEKVEFDYRLTAAYQSMLIHCTGVPYGYMCDTHTYPHREFFGIPRGMFRFEYDDTQYGRWQKMNLGTQTIPELAHDTFRNVHIPSKHKIPIVINLLGKKGLSTELALEIIDMAEYRPVGRLFIRDDPFHLANAEELKKYLGYCWKLLVRIDIMCKAGAHGKKLDWESEVTDTLCKLFNMPGKSLFKIVRCGWNRRRVSLKPELVAEDNL